MDTKINTYKQDTIEEFIDKLASKNHVPSGGGVVALNCASASALANMVVELTKKPKELINFATLNKKVELEIIPIKLKELTNKYLDYIQDDADMFNQLMESYKLQKDTEEQKKIRHKSIQDGYKLALQTPLSICELSVELFDILVELATFGNENLLSDVAIATRTLYSAFRSSMINVNINLKNIEDDKFTNQVRTRLKEIKLSNEDIKNEILTICDEKLGFEV